ncbi:MAG: sensor histidine kinase [Dehalococcoidia bacterium]
MKPERMAVPLVWIPVAAIALVVFAGLPLFGLWLTEQETSRIMRITPVREAAGELTRATTALRTSVRQYELSARLTEADPATEQEVEKAFAMAEEKVDTLSSNLTDEPELTADGEALVESASAYLDTIDTAISAIQSDTFTPEIAAETNGANAVLGAKADGFFATESSLTASRFDSLHTKERVSLLLSSISACGVIAVLLILGLRQMKLLRGRLVVAEEASQAREQMVNLASHELRNPLSIISLSAELLETQAEETGDDELARSAREVHDAALRADTLVAELLDLSRLDANRLRLNLQPVSIGPLLKDAIDVTSRHRGSREVEVSMEAETPDMVVADSARLSIVLRNLVDNAFKYSGEGAPVNVSIGNHGRQTDIDVYDRGPGVPQGEGDAIFSRFNRLEQTSHISGVGIGMYLSRELARRMGGDLRAFDGEARGHFRLTLNSPLGE